MLEAIALCEQIAGRDLNWELADEPRVGDHRWWISDLGEFQRVCLAEALQYAHGHGLVHMDVKKIGKIPVAAV